MSIFIVGIPAAVVGCVIEYAYERLSKPKAKRGGYTFRDSAHK